MIGRNVLPKRVLGATLLVLASAFDPSQSVVAADHPPFADGGYGRIEMANSCSSSVQETLQKAIAKLHSFEAGADDFRAIVRRDPSCVLALWGAAMSSRGNPLAGTLDTASLREGHAFLVRAQGIKAGTVREKALVNALDVYFRSYGGGQPVRTAAYEAAMQEVHQAYPQDPDITAFTALSILEAVDLRDASYARQRKAGAMLEQLAVAYPEHPGAAHYLIHAYDYPALAKDAVAAAERYPRLAPASSHAQHMPAHIWSMLGDWQKSIAANEQSGIIANPSVAGDTTASDIVYGHAFDFIAYARLQLAQDAQLDKDMQAYKGGAPLIVKARAALERDDWRSAAALSVPGDDPFDAAVARFTRGLGAARIGQVAQARAEVSKLRALRAAVISAEGAYWGQLIDIYIDADEAWALQAADQPSDALALMRSAADRDDGLQKHILLENKLLPMRELLGDMLISQDKQDEASTTYADSLRLSPRRYRSLLGLARADRAKGADAEARDAYSQLLALTTSADVQRDGMTEARKYLLRSGPT